MNTFSGYTPGHSDNSVNFMRHRRAATHAAFALDLFKPGLAVLDCGCGPGSITLDLARRVAPGIVVGVDAQDAQFSESREIAARDGLAVRFEAARVDSLPFADASFDAVFSHALIEHLPDPSAAAREIARVLKPGGFAALRSPDWGGFLLHPYPPPVEQAITGYRAIQARNGGDTQAGRKLPALLRANGFVTIRPSASFEIYEDPKRIAEYLAVQFDKAGDADAQAAATALRAWSHDPDAMFAQAWVEAVGWKAVTRPSRPG